MIQSPCKTQQRLLQSDLQVHIQVVAHPLEPVVRLLSDYKLQVSPRHVWHLFAFLLKQNVFASSHSFFNLDFNQLLLVHQTFTPTLGTLGYSSGSFTLARRARVLHLHLHHSHIYELSDHALALALLALRQLSVLGS